MKEIDNREVIVTYFISPKRVRKELSNYLKRKRVRIEVDDGKNIIGWSDNRIVRIKLFTVSKQVIVISFYEKYSDEAIQYDSAIRTIGALASATGAIKAATTKGRAGTLTTSYGVTKTLQAEKSIIRKLIGPTFKRNMLNLDRIEESIFITKNCGKILREGYAQALIFDKEKNKYRFIKGYLRFGEKCVLFKSNLTNNIHVLQLIPRDDILSLSKDLVKTSILGRWYTIKIITKNKDRYNYLPNDARIKKWINIYK